MEIFEKIKKWFKKTWIKICKAYSMIPWLRWVTLGVAALIFVLAIAIPIATCDKESEGKAPVSSSETSEESSSDGNVSSGAITSEEECSHSNWEVLKYTLPSCEADGEMSRVCLDCNEFERVLLPATGHDYVVYPRKEADCVNDGKTAYEACTICNDLKTVPETIPAKGHNFTDGVCLNCGEKEALGALRYELSKNGSFYAVVGLEEGCIDENIIIPSTYKGLPVRSIKAGAFKDCMQLKRVEISAASIEQEAFNGCSNLSQIVLTDKVMNIAGGVFAGTAYYNNEENWSGNVLYINNRLITAKTLNGEFTVKDGTVVIANSALAETGISSINVPDSVKVIGVLAFAGCEKLETVSIGKGVESLYVDSFSGCMNLKNINVAEENLVYKSIEGNLYTKDHSVLIRYMPGKTDESFVVPEGVKEIGVIAFNACTSLKQITISSTVENIGLEAFSGCTGLQSVVFENAKSWTCSHVNGSDTIVLTAADISDKAAVATYLKDTYSSYYWKRN